MGIFSAMTGKSPTQTPGVSTGLLDLLLGNSNPFAQFADSHQNVLGAIGAGLAAGPTFEQGLSNAGVNIPQAKQADYQANLYRASVSQTVAWLAKTHPDLAQAVQSGTLSARDAFNLAFQQDNAAPTVMPPGSSAVYLQGPKAGQTIGAPTTDGFYGSDLKAQAWNTVMKGNRDPATRNSPQYRAAWAIVTEPTMTPQGMMQPNVPPQWAPDGGAPATAAPATAAPATSAAPSSYAPSLPGPGGTPSPTGAALGDMAMVAPPAMAQIGPGIIPGTQPFNESQSRTTDLASMATPDLATAIKHYPALTNPTDQALQGISKYDPTGLAHGAQSAEYQQAYSATRSTISNILYTVSGAAIGDRELERKIEDLTPQLGDKPPVVSDKLNRLANFVSSIANATRDPQTIARAQQALQGIKAAQEAILSANSPQPASQGRVAPGTPIWGPDGRQYVMGSDGNPQPVM